MIRRYWRRHMWSDFRVVLVYIVVVSAFVCAFMLQVYFITLEVLGQGYPIRVTRPPWVPGKCLTAATIYRNRQVFICKMLLRVLPSCFWQQQAVHRMAFTPKANQGIFLGIQDHSQAFKGKSINLAAVMKPV